MAFDLLMADGASLALRCSSDRAVVAADLEGIVAKRLTDPYRPTLTRWHKILNRTYSQRHGRAEWFLKNARHLWPLLPVVIILE